MKKRESIIIIFFVSLVSAANAELINYPFLVPNGTNPSTQIQLNQPFFLWSKEKHAFRFGSFSMPTTLSANVIGFNSFAALDGAIASGRGAISIGKGDTLDFFSDYFVNETTYLSKASGENAFALCGGDASGYGAFAYGPGSESSAPHSMTFGRLLLSRSADGVAFGILNENLTKDGFAPGTYVDGSWDSGADPIFEIGAGLNLWDPDRGFEPIRFNALTVFRDGTVRLGKASGGISMGPFN